MGNAETLVFISSSAVAVSHPLEALDLLFPVSPGIELTGGCSHDPHLLQKLLGFKKAHDIDLLLHSYFPAPPEHFVLNFADTGSQTRAFVCHAMEYVQTLGIPYYSIHAGFKKRFYSDSHGILHRISDRSFTLSEIKENVSWFRAQWPVTPLALENIYPNGGDTTCAFMMSCDDICQALAFMPDICLLLDLGHLKVSAQLMGFDFHKAAHTIFSTYGTRILEIHLSENHGEVDDHLPIDESSEQLRIIREWRTLITSQHINITLETRVSDIDTIIKSRQLVIDALCVK